MANLFGFSCRLGPDDVNPMPKGLRLVYEAGKPLMGGALDPILMTHHHATFKDHIGLPPHFLDGEQGFPVH